MSRSLSTFAADFRLVASRLSLAELAVVCEVLAGELVERRVAGVARLAEVAVKLRDRAEAERLRAPIFGADCSALGGPV